MKDKGLAFIVISLLILVASFMNGYFLGVQKCPIKPIKEKVDTLVIYDTIMSYNPIYVENRVIERQLVKVTDTLNIHDTLFVYLDREQVVWQDSLSIVYASGILPQVDSVRHFASHKIITIEKSVPVRSRWGLGIQAGIGACKDGLTPYAGIGISYNLLSW